MLVRIPVRALFPHIAVHAEDARRIRLPRHPPIVATATDQYHTLAIDNQGQVWGWGNAGNGRLTSAETGAYALTPILMLWSQPEYSGTHSLIEKGGPWPPFFLLLAEDHAPNTEPVSVVLLPVDARAFDVSQGLVLLVRG